MKKISWYQKIAIQIPMIIFLVILIPVIGVSIYDIQASHRRQFQNAKDSMREELYKTSLQMRNVMQEIEAVGKKITENTEVQSLLSLYQEDPYDQKLQSSFLLILGQTAWPCNYIEEMYLITENAPYILSSSPEKNYLEVNGSGKRLYQNWLNEEKGKITWSLYQPASKNEMKIAYWRPILSSDHSFSSIVCILKEEYLLAVMDGLKACTESVNVISSYYGRMLYADAAVIDGETGLMEHPLFSQAYSKLENEGSYFAVENGVKWLVTYYNSLEDGWKYISAVPEEWIYGNRMDQKIMYILIGSGAFGVLLGSVALHLLVNRPLNRLQKKLELMESGQLESLEQIEGNNEITQVLQAYDRMIQRLKKLIDEVYIQQLLRKQAELSSLQSKMDEHFLYNTLNTIYCKASEENAAVSASMILKLSQYFRLNLSGGQDKIPLNEILEMLRAYLQIQQMRYGQTLQCKIETFPDMQNYISLKQIYQPLIENAIIHGFEKKSGKHSLSIAFRRQADRLFFIVEDDGAGMSEERCREILSEIPLFEKVQGRGYALRNIQEQIRIVYGEEYGIKINSKPKQGTRVVVEVPLEGENYGQRI